MFVWQLNIISANGASSLCKLQPRQCMPVIAVGANERKILFAVNCESIGVGLDLRGGPTLPRSGFVQLLIIWFPNKSGRFTLFRIKPEILAGQVISYHRVIVAEQQIPLLFGFSIKPNAFPSERVDRTS